MKNYLFQNSTCIADDEDITGGVDYVQSIINGSDIKYGCAAMATTEFVISPDILSVGDTFTWKCQFLGENSAVSQGIFTVKTVERYKNKQRIYAEDNMSKFNVPVDSWYAGLFFPKTLYSLLTSLCTYCGVTLAAASQSNMVNTSFSVTGGFTAQGITGRTMLQYIAEAAGCFAYISADGKLLLTRVSAASGDALTNDKYKTFTRSDYTTDVVTKVQSRITENDIGISYGINDNNIYVLEDNPLLYDNNSSAVLGAVTNIYNAIKTLTYVPATLKLSKISANIGQTVNVIQNNTTYSVLIMEKRVTASGVEVSSVGNKKREYLGSTAKQQIERLMGKSFELETSVKGLTLTVTELSEYTHSLTLEVTASAMTAAVTTAAGGTTRLLFDENGLTCYDGSFRLMHGNSRVLEMDSDGNLTLTGSIFQNYTTGKNMWISDGSIKWRTGSADSGGTNAYLEYNTSLVALETQTFYAASGLIAGMSGLQCLYSGADAGAMWARGSSDLIITKSANSVNANDYLSSFAVYSPLLNIGVTSAEIRAGDTLMLHAEKTSNSTPGTALTLDGSSGAKFSFCQYGNVYTDHLNIVAGDISYSLATVYGVRILGANVVFGGTVGLFLQIGGATYKLSVSGGYVKAI